MTDAALDLALTVLDRQLVDIHGRKCGRVDDIAFEERPGGELTVTALLVGSGAWPGRMPNLVGRLFARLGGRGVTRVPWSNVRDVTHVVKLDKPASDIGLGRGDEHAARLIEWIPGA